MSEAVTPATAKPTEESSGPRRWTLRQRVVLSIIVWAGYWFIRLLGPTLRVSVSYEDGAQKTLEERPLVASFWHECMIPATYLFRDMGIRVMSSFSYDGEYMGRIIRRFGFVAVKGSSSRNPIRALLGLRRALEDGWTVAFSLDGPRGPRRKVKPGPSGLARSSGLAMTAFHAAVDRAWILHSWDRMMIPRPFSRVLVRVGKLIPVPGDTRDEDLERYTVELQAALDRVCAFAEANVSKAGTKEFPYYKRA
ncbi:MAG: lysophospholipid acyltransferase family protein [Candidatus Sulfotelmatobacter sp.]